MEVTKKKYLAQCKIMSENGYAQSRRMELAMQAVELMSNLPLSVGSFTESSRLT